MLSKRKCQTPDIFQMVIANSDMPKVEQYQEANAKYEGKEKRLKS